MVQIRKIKTWIWIPMLIGILIVGAYFRLTGLDWDASYHLHPDERFLTMVQTAITPVSSLSEYFNTAESSLNPHNRGYTFYVYGTLPLFIVRYAAEWLGYTGYDEVHLVGRTLSAVADLLTVLLVFLIANQLYRRKSVALLAAAFSSMAVLQIQLSHYFTVDTFANFFTFLAIFFAVKVLTEPLDPADNPKKISAGDESFSWIQIKDLFLSRWGNTKAFLYFGMALGMALASKVSVAPLAIVIPAAAFIRFTQIPEGERDQKGLLLFRNLVFAALVSIVVFRIFQPYAFEGPGFFGLNPNQRWISNLSDLSQQSRGNVDFPPALQWARRPVTFAYENLIVFGLGFPLGLLATFGFLTMGWRVIKGGWQKHGLLWAWTGIYFTWQSLNFTRSMRYQIPIYPTLAIIAAWFLIYLWENKAPLLTRYRKNNVLSGYQLLSIALGTIVLAGSFAWAYAFTRIYTRPVTRVSASEWIYQNVPSAINLPIIGTDEVFTQRIPFRSGLTLAVKEPVVLAFNPKTTGFLSHVHFSNIISRTDMGDQKNLKVTVYTDQDRTVPISTNTLQDLFASSQDPRGDGYSIAFPEPVMMETNRLYYLVLELEPPSGAVQISGSISLGISNLDGYYQQYLPDPVDPIDNERDYSIQFTALSTGLLSEIELTHVIDWEAHPGMKQLQISISDAGGPGNDVSVAGITDSFLAQYDPRGQGYTFRLNRPIPLVEGEKYTMRVEKVDGPGKIALYGSRQAIETTWDDSLPLSMYGYSPFDYTRGIYRSELNFEMYWQDNEDKRERFINILNNADFLFISSNRQWGTTVRVPERYPLTTAYYRNLLGCPPDKDIVWCYRVAKPGMFEGKLGFELAAVFQSDPNLGNITFNTQFAEEAFTVYDHPKVMIFKKSASYNQEQVRKIMDGVDLSKVIHLTPREASTHPGNLLLPQDRLTIQQQGGTWSDLFNRETLFNQYPFLAAVYWYLFILVLGWVNFPFTRVALGSLADRGFPMVRMVGMLLLSYLVWLAGSAGISVTRGMILAVFILLVIGNGVILFINRSSFIAEIKKHVNYYLVVEVLFLVFFLVFLLIRLGNPDLWHPYKGGEKPMDFSYLNAVIKSTTFPPYDPWFAGGYINYYYFGFVLVGIPIKLTGILPSIGYNLVLATLFAILCMGAFSIGWNVLTQSNQDQNHRLKFEKNKFIDQVPFIGGILSAVSVMILGNLGTLRMIWQGFQKLGSPDGLIDNATILQKIPWAIKGVANFVGGNGLPYGYGEWYWNPSRVIPGEPITEFPFFTFLYADLHAHLMALPLTVLGLLWILSIVKNGWSWANNPTANRCMNISFSFMLGGLAIGALKPTNTWDYPVFLGLGILAIIYTYIKNKQPGVLNSIHINALASSIPGALFWSCLFVILFWLSFLPFSNWYGQGYTEVGLWEGSRTPVSSYLTHWGLFLFAIGTWLFVTTVDWMAKTPLSSLRRFRPHWWMIQTGFFLVIGIVVALLIMGISIAWLVVPFIIWSAILIFRSDTPDEKRFILVMIAAGLALSLTVELVVLKGDIGRMNTVFKFYLQAWTLLALSAAISLTWSYPMILEYFQGRWRKIWESILIFLFIGAALFPVMAGFDKIRDRMSSTAPMTLEGMAFMSSSSYFEKDTRIELSQDYRAIQWMQDNIKGSPVIVEANTPEYRWGNRYTIYTGLPSVVGWNWHQRQQRSVTPAHWVTERVEAIEKFYSTLNKSDVVHFLNKYNVSYIVVGQLERVYYGNNGMDKFNEWDGDLWKEIYRDGDTAIYEVAIP